MREYKLGELVTLNYGKSLPARDRIEGEYPVMSSAGVTGFHNEYLVEGPGVVIGRKGSIGTVYYEPRSFFPIDTCYFLTVNDPKVLVLKYAYYMLLDSNLKELNSDAAVPGLNREIAYAQTFSVPKIERQMEVVSILDGYNDLIENNNRRIQILETIAQKLYHEWFVYYRFPGHEQAQWQETNQGKIPAGWEVKYFTEIADVLGGGTPSTKNPEYWGGEIKFFAPKDAPDSFYVLDTDRKTTLKGIEKSSTKLYPKDTIFITARGTVGKIVLPAEDMAMNQSCYALRMKNGENQRFLFLLVKEQVAYLKKNTGGATFDTIVTDTFRSMLITVPPMKIIRQFEEFINPLFDNILCLLQKNKNLKQQRDLLLQKLIDC